MKTIKILLASVIILTSFSCSKEGRPPKGEKQVKLPCSGKDYYTDKKFIRTNASGESMDAVTSKKKALSNAKSELAGIIHSTMKTVSDNFVESNEFNNKEELLEKYVENSRTVVKEELSSIQTVCEMLVKTKSGNFKTYVCIQLPVEQLTASIHSNLSKKDRLFIDYKYEKFKEDFEKEMEKLEN
ncbi:MAG: hypothetical protein Kow0079_12920 [Vicingaceae bacterium]